MTDLTDLKRRVEEATGPDRELDAAIAVALLDGEGIGMRVGTYLVPRWTASLDATVALIERVMPGKLWGVKPEIETDPLLRGFIVRRHDSAGGPSFWTLGYGYHRDPPLALLAALLSACEQGGAK